MADETIDLEVMTVEELEQHIQKLDVVKQTVRDQQREAHAVLDRKNAELAAAAKLENLSDPEKAALLQVLQHDGIETAEEVGVPGGVDEG